MVAEQHRIVELQQRLDREVASSPQPIVQCAATIKPQAIEHLWSDVLYIGKPTLLVGDPGLGKSLATTDICARATTGRPWPLGTQNSSAGDVLMCSAEDDAADTIVPRLIAAGADLGRVEFWDSVRETDPESGRQTDRPVALDRHLEQLAAIAKRKAGQLRLVIVDPIAAFLGAADSHKNSDIRTLIAGLARIAAEYRFAVLVVSHLNKGTNTKAVYRVMGSLAFVAAARAVFAVVRDPENAEKRLMLPVKNNLAADTQGFSFQVNVADNDAPYVVWGDEAVTQETSDSVLENATLSPREEAVSARVREVCDWLKLELLQEARPANDLWRKSEEHGFSRRDVERAKRTLGVRGEVKGFRGAWHWSLPAGPK